MISSLFRFDSCGIPYFRFKEDLLSYELKQKCSARRNYKESYESARSRLKVILSPLDFSHICSTIEAKASKFKDRISNKLDKKFNNVKRKMEYRNCQT